MARRAESGLYHFGMAELAGKDLGLLMQTITITYFVTDFEKATCRSGGSA